MMKRFLFSTATLVMMIVSPVASGGDAFFTEDGKSVITMVRLPSSITGLAQIDIATGRVTALPPQDLDIMSVARGADGEILYLANDAVWVLAGNGPAKKVVSTDPVKMATDLFVGTKKGSPLMDCLFISGTGKGDPLGRGTFHARKPKGKRFEPIFCRRVEDAISGVFSAEGRLFFVSSGDLWEGSIEPQGDGGGGWMGVLVGTRIAPLGYLNTDEANGGSMVLRDVCPAGKWIYASLRGHHMGALVRTPLPAKPPFEGEAEFPSIRASYDAQSQALKSTEVLLEDECFGLCAMEVNGKPLVFFYTHPEENEDAPSLKLWTGAGAPKTIGHLPKAKDQ